MLSARRRAIPPQAAELPIDVLIVGHITRDLLPDGGWVPGGAALYASVAARRLGLRVGMVTSAPADLCAAVVEVLDGTSMVVVKSSTAATFENVYSSTGRMQYVRACAQPLLLDDIPLAWRRCDVALLVPLARECSPILAKALTARVIGAAPQGWLRQWGDDGLVHPRLLDSDETRALRHFTALIVSSEDLISPSSATVTTGAAALEEANATLARWAQIVPAVVVTRGELGADLWRGDVVERFPGYPACEVDPTGAGDVFAAIFLCTLAATGNLLAAMDQANRVAALSVEGVGPAAIPTPEQVALRYVMRSPQRAEE